MLPSSVSVDENLTQPPRFELHHAHQPISQESGNKIISWFITMNQVGKHEGPEVVTSEKSGGQPLIFIDIIELQELSVHAQVQGISRV